MKLNSGEEVIMSSNNNRIVLTNKRIIQRRRNTEISIELSEYAGYDIINKRHNFYIVAFFVFFISGFFIDSLGLFILWFIAAGFLVFYFTIFEKWVLIKGNHSGIEFSMSKLSDASLQKFIQKIEKLKKQLK